MTITPPPPTDLLTREADKNREESARLARQWGAEYALHKARLEWTQKMIATGLFALYLGWTLYVAGAYMGLW